jgi:hypothetical protein
VATVYIRYHQPSGMWFRALDVDQREPLERHGQFKLAPVRGTQISMAQEMHKNSERRGEGLLVAVEDYDGRVIKSLWTEGCRHENVGYSPTGDDVCRDCGHVW